MAKSKIRLNVIYNKKSGIWLNDDIIIKNLCQVGYTI